MATIKLCVLPRLNSIDDFEDGLHETDRKQFLTDLDKKKHKPTILCLSMLT